MSGEITALLRRINEGDSAASDELMPLVYAELRRTAQRHLVKERREHTLQPTALVNEAYLRIFEHTPPALSDRAHFLAVASRVMRRILVDHARARNAGRRGGDAQRVPLDRSCEFAVQVSNREIGLLDLDLAMEALDRKDSLLAGAIEMQYFGGMTAEEIAAATGFTVHVVRHQLRYAQAWLRRELSAPSTSI